jgi:hypothetical protein
MKQFMFVVVALVLASSAFAGTGVQAPITVTATAIVTPLTLTGPIIDLSGVKAGQKYVVVPDFNATGFAQVTPNDGAGLPVWTCTQAAIVGDANAAVLVTHYFPNKLFGTLGGGQISYSVTSNSAVWGLAGTESNYFDPSVPTVMYIDAGGAGLSVVYGGIWDVPADVFPGDTFTGYGVMLVEYTGS